MTEQVAPRRGAWIEMYLEGYFAVFGARRPSQRGVD